MRPDLMLKTIGFVVVVAGVFSAVIPYVGPTFGYPMPPGSDQPAWQWTASHTQLHLLPGVAAAVAGLLILLHKRAAAMTGAVVAVLAGSWFILGPFISDAWLNGMGGGMGNEASLVMQIITPLGYHYLPGVIALGLGAFTIGWIDAHGRRDGRPSGLRVLRTVDEGRFDRDRGRAHVTTSNATRR